MSRSADLGLASTLLKTWGDKARPPVQLDNYVYENIYGQPAFINPRLVRDIEASATAPTASQRRLPRMYSNIKNAPYRLAQEPEVQNAEVTEFHDLLVEHGLLEKSDPTPTPLTSYSEADPDRQRNSVLFPLGLMNAFGMKKNHVLVNVTKDDEQLFVLHKHDQASTIGLVGGPMDWGMTAEGNAMQHARMQLGMHATRDRMKWHGEFESWRVNDRGDFIWQQNIVAEVNASALPAPRQDVPKRLLVLSDDMADYLPNRDPITKHFFMQQWPVHMRGAEFEENVGFALMLAGHGFRLKVDGDVFNIVKKEITHSDPRLQAPTPDQAMARQRTIAARGMHI